MARALAVVGRLLATAAGPGFSPRCPRVGDLQQSQRPAGQPRGATTARTPGLPHACRAGRAARILPGTGGARPAVVARGSPRAPRSARQPASPFGAPALQHLPAAFRRHALTESVRLRTPATVRLERPLHCVLLVRVLRTARSSYRWAADAVKHCAAPPRAGAVAASKIPVLWWAARLGDGGAYTWPRRCARGPHGPCGESSAAGDDGRAPGVIHRRG